ncbi:nitroreductase family protein [Methanobrevibacter sp. DSM 116169]|uniref:nitroreductase family protein n=1 Tax=Methanobrevibacter sp. DSM 116169 TaxID=3242727 RepID=UPI0038FCE4A1
METLDTINKRKSIRGYESKDIEKEKLDTLLDVANKAPNAGPFQLTVIQNKDLLNRINVATKDFMLNSGNEFFESRAKIPGYEPMYGAPCMIIFSAPEEGFGQVNCACSATTMILEATDLDLGSCYVVSPVIALGANPELAKKLNLPEGFTPVCGVLLGYANGEGFPSTGREEVDNINYI